MEITKKNFIEKLPVVKEAIDKSDFIVIDTELTGLYREQSTEHAFDSMEERYQKLHKLCSQFLVIQYGVSTFKYHPTEKKFTHSDFNFYVFPHPHIKEAPDQRFLCQTSSLHFLASNEFDFNKVIYEGIPYLRPDQEEKLKEYISNKYEVQRSNICTKKDLNINGQTEVNIPDEHKQFIDQVKKKVETFMSNESETVIKLETCSGYRRKLIYETLKQKYTTGIEMETLCNENKDRYIVISKMNDKDKLHSIGLKETIDMDDIDNAVGFRKVLEYISQSKKLVIGHHMYLDIFHTINQFFHPLPESLKEYKEILNLVFPYLIDTKCLASCEQLRPLYEVTHLGIIFKSVQEKQFDLPMIEIEEGYQGYNLSESKAHEAGFDAFMTGVVFIGLSRKLSSLRSKSPELLNASSAIISPFINRFFVLRHYDVPTLNICGPDLEPSRDNVFFVSFPKEWKTIDLVELFLPYGEIYVHWIDDVSALVALKNPVNLISAKSALLNKSSKMYRVRSYADYQKMAGQHSLTDEAIKKPVSPTVPIVHKKVLKKENRSSMELIPECDENEAEEALSGKRESSSLPVSEPCAKKLKKSFDDQGSGEVSSTFAEGNDW